MLVLWILRHVRNRVCKVLFVFSSLILDHATSFNAMLELLPMAKSQLSELFVHIELHSELWVFCAAFDERVGVCDQFVQC